MIPDKFIQIKKTTEVPAIGSSRKYKYPLDELTEVGDYFEIPRPEGEQDLPRPDKYRTLCGLRSHVTYYLRTEAGQGKKFACRQLIGDKDSEYPGKQIVVCIRTL